MLFVPPSMPFMAPAAEAQAPPPTLTASAYLNATANPSGWMCDELLEEWYVTDYTNEENKNWYWYHTECPTGRTLALTGTNIDPDLYSTLSSTYVKAKIYKDGEQVLPRTDVSWQSDPEYGFKALRSSDPSWQIPVPPYWTAGTYDIVWTLFGSGPGVGTHVLSESNTLSFTMPEYPAPEVAPTPTLTASAFLNATATFTTKSLYSSTCEHANCDRVIGGRTLELTVTNNDPDLYSEIADNAIDVRTFVKVAIYKDGERILPCRIVSVQYGGNGSCHESQAESLEVLHNFLNPFGYPNLTTWQMTIPVEWTAGTYDATWTLLGMSSSTGYIDVALSESSTLSFTVPALPTIPSTTLTASAYINATSPTDRTLMITGTDIDPLLYPDIHPQQGTQIAQVRATIYKDGQPIVPSPAHFYDYFVPWHNYLQPFTPWQIPIPSDWTAGTYDVVWALWGCCSTWQNSPHGYFVPLSDSSPFYGETEYAVGFDGLPVASNSETEINGQVSFTVPELPAGPTPTLTVTAIINATSATGRTMNFDVDKKTYGSLKFAWFDGTTIFGPNGVEKADFFPMITYISLMDDNTTLQGDFPLWNGGSLGSLQLDIPTEWEAGTYVITWNGLVWEGINNCTVCDGDTVGTPDSTTVTIPALPGAEEEESGPTPTLTASAYLNSTSTTGRTLAITANDTDTMPSIYFSQTTLSKNGSVVFPTGSSGWNINLCYISCSPYATDSHKISIPTAWEAGVYLISWSVWDFGSESSSTSGTTSVIIPALPAGPTPTLTASAYLNATSPTGRTLAIAASDTYPLFSNHFSLTIEKYGDVVFPIGSSEWNINLCYIGCSPPSANYYLPIPADWEAGAYEINWSTTWWDAIGSNYSSGEYWVSIPDNPATGTPPIVNVPNDIVLAPDPVPSVTFTVNATSNYGSTILNTLCSTNTIALDGISLGTFYGHNFPIGDTIITCTATDGSGDVGTGTFTVTVNSSSQEEEEIVIPSWIKSNAGWWDAGLIDNRNYVTGLQWLITNGIMTIPSTEQGTGSDDVIPSWVKNNARWWADGSIDDRNYVTGLQWLITNGVMTIG